MDPHSFIARAEAQRWLGIAEKLLIDHDLVGSKSFAIRARESDPRLEAADQILAIADTLLAAEKRLVGNSRTQQPDFYAILQLSRFVQDTDHIASQYRRLAVILNPHQNRFPFSDQAFQLVNDAWAVLSNPTRKSMYDAELDFQQMNTTGFNLEQEHQEQHDFFTIDHMDSDHEHELPEPHQIFETRAQQSHQQQFQHYNFLSQNSVRSVPFREDEQLFEHHDQVHFLQPQVHEVTSAPHQQIQPPPQPPMQPPTPPPPAPPAQPPSQPQQQVKSNDGVMEEEGEPVANNMDNSPTFWTACPFCFFMYEYPKIYAECTLRCDNCKRAYQAVPISSPPSMAEGQEPYFYCWGYFPVGVSISHLSKNNRADTNSKWTPFSPLYDTSSNVHNHNRSNPIPAPKKNNIVNKSSGPRVYIDDDTDDIFTGISEPSDDDSDVEWNSKIEKG